MDLRIFAAASVLAAMGVIGGCGSEDPGEPTAGSDSAWSDDPAPTPDSASPGTVERDPMAPRSGSDVAGQQGGTTDDYRGDRMSGQPGQTGTGTGTGTGTDTGTGMETGTQPEMGMTEFAALDTNSDGRIQEEDWRPELVNGLEFDEVDLDGSGDIDQQEFEQAMAQQSGQTGRSSTDTEMGTETETEDPTGS